MGVIDETVDFLEDYIRVYYCVCKLESTGVRVTGVMGVIDVNQQGLQGLWELLTKIYTVRGLYKS